MIKRELKGLIFGKLTVLEKLESRKGMMYWLCSCECGNKVEVPTSRLMAGITRSCGCYNVERAKDKNTTHNKSYTKLYKVYATMKTRCYNTNVKKYKNYGARGIKICKEWLESFEKFYEWSINNGYKYGLSLDRIDTEKDYTPTNCRWTDIKTQENNRTNNVKINYRNQTHTIAEWSDITGINYFTLYCRYKNGWDAEKILTFPVRKKGAVL